MSGVGHGERVTPHLRGYNTSLLILIALICVVSVCLSVDNDHLNIKVPPREFGGHLGRRSGFSLMFADKLMHA